LHSSSDVRSRVGNNYPDIIPDKYLSHFLSCEIIPYQIVIVSNNNSMPKLPKCIKSHAGHLSQQGGYLARQKLGTLVVMEVPEDWVGEIKSGGKQGWFSGDKPRAHFSKAGRGRGGGRR
jgi:hypothetical protein